MGILVESMVYYHVICYNLTHIKFLLKFCIKLLTHHAYV